MPMGHLSYDPEGEPWRHLEDVWGPTQIYDWKLTLAQLLVDGYTEMTLTSDYASSCFSFLAVQCVQEDWKAIYGDRAEW